MSREVVNISLPPKLKEEMDKEVKRGRYASRSEFFRHLLRMWIEKDIEEVSDAEQRDIEKRHGKPSRKRAGSYTEGELKPAVKRRLDRLEKDVREGKNLSPTFESTEEATRYLHSDED